MGQTFEEMKIQNMSYKETIKSLKETFDNQFKVKQFEEILDNFKKFNEEKRITRFPLDTLKKLLLEKKKDRYFDLIVQTKKEYFMHFKKYYKSHSGACGPFANIFKNTNDYEELLKEQNFYLKYKELVKSFQQEYELSSLSFSVRLHLATFIRLENNEREWIKYLSQKNKEEFSDDEYIDSTNLEEKQRKFFESCAEKDLQKYSKKKNYYKEDDDDDDDDYNTNNYSYDNTISNNNYDNDNDNDNYKYRPNHTSSSSHRGNYYSTNYSKNSNSNQSKNTSDTKKKVKVIICYSCKGKKKCPLCGNKMNSLVSLGNLYAHSDCYNEGTCCLCHKKGAGNQVMSICSDCRKSSASKGLTGSARCFICRKLI